MANDKPTRKASPSASGVTTTAAPAARPVAAAPSTKKVQTIGNAFKRTPEKDLWSGEYEFGGPIGAACIMVFSHFIVYYLWICVDFYDGSLIHPFHSALGSESFSAAFFRILSTRAVPTLTSFCAFVGFLLAEYLLAVLLPGPKALGLPVPSENGYVHKFKCNGVYCWYIILATLATVHFTGIYPLTRIRENYGEFVTSAIIVADVGSVFLYLFGVLTGRAVRMSGNVVYDFFMGAALNPKFPGNIDMKLFAEIRNSWVLTFTLALSSAAKMYEKTGTLSPNMFFILTAYLLYCNACQKGEECICTTWDIHHEKFGWMLVFWNTCGVAFVYSLQAAYLANCAPTFSWPWYVLLPMYVALFAAYFVWDTTNAQKNRFRMERVGVDPKLIHRKTFPQLPFGYIKNPRTITSERGTLFVDGWYRYARKIHYTADVVMATLWALSCGFTSLVPWYYPVFFIGMILDREQRDVARSAVKYGPLWQEYIKLVPYKYVPGLI
jgi:delta24(24(1))-sterol reductase